MKKVEAQDGSEKQVIKTWSRRSTIFPNFINHLQYTMVNVPVYVTEDMVGSQIR